MAFLSPIAEQLVVPDGNHDCAAAEAVLPLPLGHAPAEGVEGDADVRVGDEVTGRRDRVADALDKRFSPDVGDRRILNLHLLQKMKFGELANLLDLKKKTVESATNAPLKKSGSTLRGRMYEKFQKTLMKAVL